MFAIQQNNLDASTLQLKLNGSNVQNDVGELLSIYIANVQDEDDYDNYRKKLLCV